MGKRLVIISLCFFVFFAAGCSMIENEYTAITPHIVPSAAQEDEAKPSIASANDSGTLRAFIMGCIRAGSSRNMVDITNYQGDIDKDFTLLLKRLQANSLYAYAVDYMDHDFITQNGSTFLELSMVYRRSAEEIAAIVSVRGMTQAQEEIARALNEFNSSLTLRISGYYNMDYSAWIAQYCMEHPELIVTQPETTVSVFPDTGRSRVLELHFGYAGSKTDMRNMQRNMATLLRSASNFAARGNNSTEKLALLCQYLVERTHYDPAGNSNQDAYNLLCRQQASDRGFASVMYYLMNQANISCYLVEGTRNNVPYCWNIVLINGQYRHIDMMRQWQESSKAPIFYTDAEMTEYTWDLEEYPACVDSSTEISTTENISPTS